MVTGISNVSSLLVTLVIIQSHSAKAYIAITYCRWLIRSYIALFAERSDAYAVVVRQMNGS